MARFERGFVALCALLLAVALLVPAVAASPHPGEIRGTVQSVDYGSSKLVVRTRTGSESVDVAPSTQIYLRGRNATLAEVRVGGRVAIRVSEIDGRLVAQIIRMS